MDGPAFDLWLEYEHYQPIEGDDPENNFFIVELRLPTGEHYSLNVWTMKYFEQARSDYKTSGENLGGKYLLPPSLFVERLDRKLLEDIVADLIRHNSLLENWRVQQD